jgi:hypothetical protein
MNWFLALYLIILTYLSTGRHVSLHRPALKNAWFFFALIPFAEVLFALIRVSNQRDPSDLMLVEMWSSGAIWLLLGVSLFSLINSLFRDDDESP